MAFNRTVHRTLLYGGVPPKLAAGLAGARTVTTAETTAGLVYGGMPPVLAAQLAAGQLTTAEKVAAYMYMGLSGPDAVTMAAAGLGVQPGAADTGPKAPATFYYATNPVVPATMSVGDQMLLLVWQGSRISGGTPNVPTATGWTQVKTAGTGTGDGGGIRLTALKRACQGGDAGSTVTVSITAVSGEWFYAAVVGNPGRAVADAAATSLTYGSGGSTIAAPSVTTTEANQRIYYFSQAYRGNGGATMDITDPVGVTNVIPNGGQADTHGAVRLSTEVQAAAGASASRTFTETSGGGNGMTVLAIPMTSA